MPSCNGLMAKALSRKGSGSNNKLSHILCDLGMGSLSSLPRIILFHKMSKIDPLDLVSSRPIVLQAHLENRATVLFRWLNIVSGWL